ncbi:MAG: GGDEF domain-containing protein [Lachnospiraceae bacterium]|nr:GGDEF domain-containing protein [Lachnospiraceae bacterium]
MQYKWTYEKWRFLILKYLSYIVGIIFLLELVVLIYVKRVDLLVTNTRTYLLKYMMLPILTNSVSLFFGYYLLKKETISDRIKNYVPLACVLVFCFVISTVHNFFLITASIFVIPVMLSSFYGSKRITTATLFMSVLLLLNCTLSTGFDANDANFHMRIMNGMVAFCLLISSYLLSIMMMKYAKEKETELSESIRSAYQLEEQLKKDPLTGLYNHSNFYAYLEDGIIHAEEQRNKVCLAVLDIDFFKKVNDTYGHERGNVVLTGLSELLIKYCEEYGHACRYGGEEFSLVFKELEISEVYRRMEKLRKEIEEQTYITNVHITISIGIAEYKSGMTAQELFDNADKAMYLAKKNGRNQVVVYTD